MAVAARDRSRAGAFAAEHGIARVHDSYASLIADPDVDLVYNALVNSLHAQWNVAALQAGKHVLSEKPLTSNAAQAHAVRTAARTSPGRIAEGFHYRHHPVNLRLRELVTSGALGGIRSVDLVLAIPAPPSTDPRWSWELGGGATMDLGCYVLDAATAGRDCPRAARRGRSAHQGRLTFRPGLRFRRPPTLVSSRELPGGRAARRSRMDLALAAGAYCGWIITGLPGQVPSGRCSGRAARL